MARTRGARGAHRAVALVAGAVVVALALSVAPPAGATRLQSVGPSGRGPRCPWVGQSRRGASPVALADEVLARLTLAEKVGLVTLRDGDGIENLTTPVARLCIPALTLSDGPDGVAGRVRGVTQFPSALDLAASFDPSLARAVGEAVGAEARAKGIDVVQAPELNLDRVPLSGRLYETLGEDPTLAGWLGLAEARGVAAAGDLAMVKHLGVYTQETARARLDQSVGRRALVELYDAPFRAVIQGAHVSAVMCATGLVNGVRPCDSPYFYGALARWGFRGLVRADLRATTNTALAFGRGLDVIKGAHGRTIGWLVRHHLLAARDLDRAVRRVLTVMFAHGLVAYPRHLDPAAPAATPAHTALALAAAEAGITLLKDQGGALPLRRPRSVAVIGPYAVAPLTVGQGSAHVVAPFVVTPLAGLRAALGARTRVTYAPGAPPRADLRSLRALDADPTTTLPSVALSGGARRLVVRVPANVSNAVITADAPGTGRGWSRYATTLRVRRAGRYVLSLRTVGDAWLTLDGRTVLASRGLHAPSVLSTTLALRPHRRYDLAVRWFSVIRQAPPAVGLVDATGAIRAAVAAARRAQVAVVVVGDPAGEGSDLASLALPGDQDRLIEEVAAANPNTVVVLDTSNPVAMPWLSRVRAVVETWFAGEEMGRALAAVLTGAVDPSGRLPVTFPVSLARSPLAAASSYPGVDDVVHLGAGVRGLEVGYRWYEAHHVAPLFPFGFGLSYTRFALGAPRLGVSGGTLSVSVPVTNTGRRAGTEVVEVYVTDPRAAGEPFAQLRAVTRLTLAPGERGLATASARLAALAVYTHGRLHLVPGSYTVAVATSASRVVATRTVSVR